MEGGTCIRSKRVSNLVLLLPRVLLIVDRPLNTRQRIESRSSASYSLDLRLIYDLSE